MNFPQIRLESQYAKIQLNRTPAALNIEQKQADVSIQQPKPDLHIETTPSRLTIDQTEAWADMDLKSMFRRTREEADKGRSDVMAGIARRAQEGMDLMKIEQGGNPIPQHSKVNSQKPLKEFNIGWIPSHFSVKTSYEPSKVNIDWKVNKPMIDVQTNKPTIDYTPGKVDVELVQKESLKVDFANLKHVGINYEQEI
ncbi:DUF6470 family protein [Bacillus sp. PS06]|uniref:DUF6470 family protein n=1 Tax=Bacillus sp. PS06 TaxID=2764176 RepID=UPI00177C2F51|nr:DUF6470 family protein [Bacillus sp. PS06]MBD8071397.1 hypothetical protein [Bacillus sp. PS06]